MQLIDIMKNFEQLIQASKKVEVGDDITDVEYEVECFDFRSPEFHQESGKHNGLDKLTIPDDIRKTYNWISQQIVN